MDALLTSARLSWTPVMASVAMTPAIGQGTPSPAPFQVRPFQVRPALVAPSYTGPFPSLQAVTAMM